MIRGNKDIEKMMIKQLFTNILTDDPVGDLSQEVLDPALLRSLFREDPERFLDEYRKSYCSFTDTARFDSCSETAANSAVLLRLIEINLLLTLDPCLVADGLVRLANWVLLLETVYETDTFDGRLGTVIGFRIKTNVCALLRRQPDEAKDFTVNALSQMPVTNTALALWQDCALKRYGVRVSRKVTAALKAMYLHDVLLGSGIRDLLLQKPKESVEKRLKTFDSVGLHELTERILAYYSCKTGNEKKRFFSDIENYMGDFNMIEAANRFLSEN